MYIYIYIYPVRRLWTPDVYVALVFVFVCVGAWSWSLCFDASAVQWCGKTYIYYSPKRLCRFLY